MLHVRALVIGMAAACALSTFARAQTAREAGGCVEELYAILERDLKVPALTPLRNGGNIAAESCKPWPYRPSLTLAAIAYDGGVKDEKQLVVAVVNRGTRRVVASYRRTLLEDGFNKTDEHSLQVDAAPYQVGKDIRAFALRFNNAASAGSCVNSRSASELTLLVPEGQHLRAILSIDMHQERALTGCLGSGSNSDTVAETADLAIGIEQSSTNGFRDLAITARITTDSRDSQSATERPSNRLERTIFRYDNAVYRRSGEAPWWLGF